MQHQVPVNNSEAENANNSFFKKTKKLAQNHPYITGILAGTVYGLMGTAILPAAAVPFAYAGIGSLMGAGAAGITSYLGKRKASNANLDAPAEQPAPVEQPVIMNEQPVPVVPVVIPVVPAAVPVEQPVIMNEQPASVVPVVPSRLSPQKKSNIIPDSRLLDDKQSGGYTFGDYEEVAEKFERENILPFINKAPETVATPKKTPVFDLEVRNYTPEVKQKTLNADLEVRNYTPEVKQKTLNADLEARNYTPDAQQKTLVADLNAGTYTPPAATDALSINLNNTVNTVKSPKSTYALSANINKRVKREQLDTPENPLPQQYFVVNPSNPLTKNIKMEQPRNTFVSPVIRPTAPLNLPQPESPDLASANGGTFNIPASIRYSADIDDDSMSNNSDTDNDQPKSNKRPRNQ